MAYKKSITQCIWGAALLFAGVGVFYRIPQVMPKIQKIEQFSSASWVVYACFYLMGILLIGGGVKKIIANYKDLSAGKNDSE